VIPST
jgi:hypothetical protein